MDKKTYYVSVQSGEMWEDPTIATYEFIIEATEQQAGELQELFEKAHEKDGDTFIRSHTPYIGFHDDKENYQYDLSLKEIYTKIHELGNETSRRHIESMLEAVNPDTEQIWNTKNP
jgi:hypothetical protein